MLTRFEVSGFKNLQNVTVDFGPFTCIAGPNSVGKSNLFDAIELLSLLSEHTFLEACTQIRPTSQQRPDIFSLFPQNVITGKANLSIAAEMIVPSSLFDEFNERVEPERTFMRYELEIALSHEDHLSRIPRLRLIRETLSPITYPQKTLRFPTSTTYIRNFIKGSARFNPIETITGETTNTTIQINNGRQGKPRRINADNSQRTVLSAVASAENPLILAAQTEMRSWRFVALEPSAMRAPDTITENRPISATGAHIPSSLYRQSLRGNSSHDVMLRVRDTISSLVDIRSLDVIPDETRETLELQARIGNSPKLPARSLSDGTLRFLALSAMKVSNDYFGMLCMEEPENGIHPSKIADMHQLLLDIAQPTEDSPRQVIVNTHSPYFVQETNDEDILCAVAKSTFEDTGEISRIVSFQPLSGTWRHTAGSEDTLKTRPVSRGRIAAYLSNPNKWDGDDNDS